jgi:hypothetical protein
MKKSEKTSGEQSDGDESLALSTVLAVNLSQKRHLTRKGLS